MGYLEINQNLRWMFQTGYVLFLALQVYISIYYASLLHHYIWNHIYSMSVQYHNNQLQMEWNQLQFDATIRAYIYR